MNEQKSFEINLEQMYPVGVIVIVHVTVDAPLATSGVSGV